MREFKCGRRESNDIVFKDISISRLHCKFIVKDGSFFV